MRLRLCWGRHARLLLAAGVIMLLHIFFIHLYKEEDNMIPKQCTRKSPEVQPFERNFHQIWTTEDIPEKWAKLQRQCQQMNPDYNYMLWTHERINKFMQENYPWFMETFWSYPYQMQRLDAARYFILYHYGGVYIDMDMECLDTFDNIFYNTSKAAPTADIVLGATTPIGVTSSFLMAKQHHSFMSYITNRLTSYNNWYLSPYWTVLLSTGPLYLFRSSRSFPCREQIYIIPAQIHTKHYLDHKHASSWHSWDGPIMLWFERHGKLLICLTLLLIVTLTVFTIHRKCCKHSTSKALLRHSDEYKILPHKR